MVKPDAEPSFFDPEDDGEWEELSEDNGEIITFKVGESYSGAYVKVAVIELPEEQQKEVDGELQTTADMYVFDKDGNRWSVWATFQLRKAMAGVIPGDIVRITCKGERKTGAGSMKVFSVQRKIQ